MIVIHSRAQAFFCGFVMYADYYLFEYMNGLAEHWQYFSDGSNMIDKCSVTHTRFHLGGSVVLPQITFRTS